jgi:hypothetical protein
VVSRKNRHGKNFSFYLNWDIDRGIIEEVYQNGSQNDPQKDSPISG